MNTDRAVEIRQVSKIFRVRGKPLTAVNGVSLSVRVGEILALLGKNGAGKTTLLDMVLGLSQPTAGHIRVMGMEPGEAVTAGKLGATLQSGGLLKDLSVKDQVAMVAATYPKPVASLETVLETAGIAHIAHRKISRCSGGQQQSVRLALALLGNPDILVLDEPTAGMDINARTRFWETMHRAAVRGKTIIFATHHLDEAQNFAQRIVILDRGAVLTDDSVDHLRAATASRLITFDLPDTSALNPEHLTNLEVSAFTKMGNSYRLRTPRAEDLLRFLLTHYRVKNLEVSAPSLTDEFTRLTAGNHP